MLRRRLIGRGIALSAVLGPTLLTTQTHAALPARLAAATLTAAMQFAARQQSLNGIVSETVIFLVESALKHLAAAKIKLALGALALIACVGLVLAVTLRVSAELIDPRTVAPLDVETIAQSVRKTGRLLIVDGAFAPFGIGAEIAAQISDRAFDDLDAPIRRLNGAHTPTPYSPPLENAVVPNVDAIAQAIRDLIAQ